LKDCCQPVAIKTASNQSDWLLRLPFFIGLRTSIFNEFGFRYKEQLIMKTSFSLFQGGSY